MLVAAIVALALAMGGRGADGATVAGPTALATPTVTVAATQVVRPAPRALFWGVQTAGPESWGQLTRRNIRMLASFKFDGFLIENLFGGLEDTFFNGGAARIRSAADPSTYRDFRHGVQRLVTYARGLGMSTPLIRLNADDCGWRNGVRACGWNIFDPAQVTAIVQSARNEARFARQTGLAGIWIDAEPYDSPTLWNQQPPGPGDAYYSLGRRMMQAMVDEYPGIRIFTTPGFGFDNQSKPAYTHYPDFYAGMASVAPKAGIVVTTEATYGNSDGFMFRFVQCYELATCDRDGRPNGTREPNPILATLRRYDALNGNSALEEYFRRNTTVALSTAIANYRDSPQFDYERLGAALRGILALTPSGPQPAYLWVYDGSPSDPRGPHYFLPSYTCPAAWGPLWPRGFPCEGRILRDVLPSPLAVPWRRVGGARPA